MSDDILKIELNKDEALVLFDFLSRFSEDEKLRIDHQAEERVLWNITCILEELLVEPFLDNYLELLEDAREKVKDSEE